MRREYRGKTLRKEELAADPFLQFSYWFDEACNSSELEPNAMALATVSSVGEPSCRMVLMKSYDAHSVTFYTHYSSRKGRELQSSPQAAATFWWASLARQVRMEGSVEMVSEEESEKYFSTRPRSSQLAAWASRQSHAAAGREELEAAFQREQKQWADSAIAKPPYWGGFRLTPQRIQLWQGGADRLHDSFLYRYSHESSSWELSRLWP